MQIVVEAVGDLERKVLITVPAEQVVQATNKKIQHVARTAKIDGFRPGKVPITVVHQQFGKSIEYDVINKIIGESLDKALKEKNLQPAGVPNFDVTEYESGKPLSFTATFEVFPEISLKPFGELVIEKAVVEVTDADIEQTLEGMRKQRTQWEEVDRPAETGDRVWLKFTGTIEGKEFDGGKADNMPLILGAGQTIAGFEDGILQHKTGESFNLDLQFPENYGAKELAGKPVTFAMTLNKIEAPNLPPLDDEFAKFFGIDEGDGMQKLREEVRQTLQQQRDRALRQQLKNEVAEKLRQAYVEIAVPNALIQQEAVHLKEQMEKQLGQWQKNASSLNLQTEMFMGRAKERVLTGLLFKEIIQKFALKPDTNKVKQLVEELASQYDESLKIIEWYYQDRQRMAGMENMALEEQVVDKIMDEATIVEKIVPLAEFLKQGGAQ